MSPVCEIEGIIDREVRFVSSEKENKLSPELDCSNKDAVPISDLESLVADVAVGDTECELNVPRGFDEAFEMEIAPSQSLLLACLLDCCA
jgi:hypothetical protein